MDKSKLMNAVQLGFIDQDGKADSIDALSKFILACQRQGQSAGYLPGLPANKRGYRYKGRAIYNRPRDGLVIPPRFALLGDGPARTRFFQDPATFERPVNWPSYCFMFYSSGSTIEGLGFDGQRRLVNGGAETRFGSTFIKAAEQSCRDATFRDLAMTGNLGGLQESFCISTSPQEDGALFENVVCNDNNGSGISCNGDMVRERANPGTGLNRHIRVLNCVGNNNTWQGITFYGCQDSLLQNFRGAGNGSHARYAGNGANFEWTYRMHIAGGAFTGNVGGGIGGYGDNDALLLDGAFDIHGNNTMHLRTTGEISFAKGPWWDSRKGPIVGLLRSLSIRGGRIRPVGDWRGAGAFHLNVDLRQTKEVTYPSRGPPALPLIDARGVANLTDRQSWHLTQNTDESGLRVSA